jgi:hypothetical protein
MKIKALITTLVLGSSSLAVAAPAVRDHRAPVVAPLWHRPAPRPLRPVTLATSQNVKGREVIRVSTSQRAFTKLELQSKKGRTKLDKVMITFANGGTQLIDCNALIKNGQKYSIDLKGNARNIKSITLVGKSGKRALLDVVAV